MVDPTQGKVNPSDIQSFVTALEHSLTASHSPATRAALNGNEYVVSDTVTITPTQSARYIYLENPTSQPFVMFSDHIKARGGDCEVRIFDESDIDASTFSAGEYHNVRSDVTQDPPQNLRLGYRSDVTINDFGRLYDQGFINTSSHGRFTIGTDTFHSVSYIIGSNSSALVEIDNVSSNDVDVTTTLELHENRDVPRVTD